MACKSRIFKWSDSIAFPATVRRSPRTRTDHMPRFPDGRGKPFCCVRDHLAVLRVTIPLGLGRRRRTRLQSTPHLFHLLLSGYRRTRHPVASSQDSPACISDDMAGTALAIELVFTRSRITTRHGVPVGKGDLGDHANPSSLAPKRSCSKSPEHLLSSASSLSLSRRCMCVRRRMLAHLARTFKSRTSALRTMSPQTQ